MTRPQEPNHERRKPVDPKVVEVARIAEEMAPPDYPFLRLNIEDLTAALRRMTTEQN